MGGLDSGKIGCKTAAHGCIGLKALKSCLKRFRKALLYRIVTSRDGRFVHDWLKASLAASLILCIAVAAPIYYIAVKTDLDPALLPRATLTNGEKTVVLQRMMHIGTERFYKQVVYDAKKAPSDGYVPIAGACSPTPRATSGLPTIWRVAGTCRPTTRDG